MITYIDDSDVKNNLPVKECVDELREAFISYGKGESDSSPRDRINGKDFVFSTMPAFYEKRGIAGLKTYIFGKNGYRFFVIIFDTADTELDEIRAMIDKNIDSVKNSEIIYISCTAMTTSKILYLLYQVHIPYSGRRIL